MQSDTPHPGVSTEALKRKHECSDPHLPGVLLGVVITVLMLVLTLVIVALIIPWFSRGRATSPAPFAGTIVAPGDGPLAEFPAPHLQIKPRLDHQAFLARASNELATYGWIDPKAGTVRIPIERAMDLLLERGLPVRQTNQPVPASKSSLQLIQERAKAK